LNPRITQFTDAINWFNTISYLVHPLLHELWTGAKGKLEVNHLMRFGNAFFKSGRLVQPNPSSQIKCGRACPG
jgi:hypothetical protein